MTHNSPVTTEAQFNRRRQSPTPTPSPTWSPEQQAAIDTVQAYLSKWNEISQDPGSHDLEEIREYAADPIASGDIDLLNQWRSKGWHLVGTPVFTPGQVNPTIIDESGQQYNVYGCYSIIGATLVDQDGKQVDNPDRQDIAGSMYTTRVNSEGQFVIGGKDVDWSC